MLISSLLADFKHNSKKTYFWW